MILEIRRMSMVIGVMGLTGLAPLYAQSQATVIKETPLLAAPALDAQKLATLQPNTPLQVLDASGAWLHAKAPPGEGYVRRFHVHLNTISAQGGGGAAVLGLVTGRQGKGNIVATMGARGLGEEQLAKASYDDQQLAQLDAYTVSPQEAQQQAMAKGLKAREVNVKTGRSR